MRKEGKKEVDRREEEESGDRKGSEERGMSHIRV